MKQLGLHIESIRRSSFFGEPSWCMYKSGDMEV